MNKKTLTLVGAAAFAAYLTSATAFAGQVDVFKKDLQSVAAPEMAAKAAQLVSDATADAREATASAVVSAAIGIKPVATVSVVVRHFARTPGSVTRSGSSGSQPVAQGRGANCARSRSRSAGSRGQNSLFRLQGSSEPIRLCGHRSGSGRPEGEQGNRGCRDCGDTVPQAVRGSCQCRFGRDGSFNQPVDGPDAKFGETDCQPGQMLNRRLSSLLPLPTLPQLHQLHQHQHSQHLHRRLLGRHSRPRLQVE